VAGGRREDSRREGRCENKTGQTHHVDE
jgi:hypothetical protein